MLGEKLERDGDAAGGFFPADPLAFGADAESGQAKAGGGDAGGGSNGRAGFRGVVVARSFTNPVWGSE